MYTMTIKEGNVVVEETDGVITKVGRTYMPTPEVKWNGKGIKWFDDSKLLRKQVK